MDTSKFLERLCLTVRCIAIENQESGDHLKIKEYFYLIRIFSLSKIISTNGTFKNK